MLANQFELHADSTASRFRRASTVFGLIFADLFAGIIFTLLFAWEAIMSVFSLACLAISVSLFAGFNLLELIPPMPYWCGAVFGLSFAALAVLTAMGCIYFAAFVRQLMRAYSRFHHNAIAAASGKVVLPSIAIYPKLPAKANHRIRLIALISILLFAVSFILGLIASMLSSGALGFWHVWGWFGSAGSN